MSAKRDLGVDLGLEWYRGWNHVVMLTEDFSGVMFLDIESGMDVNWAEPKQEETE